jgi:hypothetical protein
MIEAFRDNIALAEELTLKHLDDDAMQKMNNYLDLMYEYAEEAFNFRKDIQAIYNKNLKDEQLGAELLDFCIHTFEPEF